MTNREEQMQVIIDLAKKKVESWYNPGTTRQWTCTVAGNNAPQFSDRPEERTEMYVLTGGEAKGFVIAFHGLGKVIAYNTCVTQSKEYNIKDATTIRQACSTVA